MQVWCAELHKQWQLRFMCSLTAGRTRLQPPGAVHAPLMPSAELAVHPTPQPTLLPHRKATRPRCMLHVHGPPWPGCCAYIVPLWPPHTLHPTAQQACPFTRLHPPVSINPTDCSSNLKVLIITPPHCTPPPAPWPPCTPQPAGRACPPPPGPAPALPPAPRLRDPAAPACPLPAGSPA